MIRDSRLSSVLHALLHMASHEGPMTSEALARCMGTNPVVVRRVMAGLREAGFVRSEKGHGGGWSIDRSLDSVTLRDVHAALGEPAVLALGHRNPAPTCLVEQAVNAALDQTYREIEAMLLARLGAVTLGALAEDFARRMADHPCRNGGSDHAV